MRKFFTTAIVAVVALFSMGLAVPAQAAVAPTEVTKTARFKIIEAGKIVPMNANAVELATAYPPTTTGSRYRFLFSTNNIERMICIKDYTATGDSVWVPKWAAQLWDASSNKFGMVWDDMQANGSPGESNCISYDASQTIAMYSYTGTEADGCGEIEVAYNSEQWLIRATVWLNTASRLRSCRYTQVLRQNVVVGAVGYTLGLRYFNASGVYSVMNTDLVVAEQISAPTQLDKNAVAFKYQYS